VSPGSAAASSPVSPVPGVDQRLALDEFLVDKPDPNQGQDEGVEEADHVAKNLEGNDGADGEAEAGGEDHEQDPGHEGVGHHGEDGEGDEQLGPDLEVPGELPEPLHRGLRKHEVELLLVGPVLPAASDAGASLGLGSLNLRRRGRRGGGLEWRRWASRRGSRSSSRRS